MRKSILVIGLIGAMTIIGIGCGKQDENQWVESDSPEPTAVESEQQETEQPDVDQPAADQTDAETETADADVGQTDTESAENVESDITIPELNFEKRSVDAGVDSSAIEFVENMKIGWNLGNTFDANSDNNRADEMSFESYWCGIVTTKEMIDAIKAAGFETIRIPVSWHNHVSDDGNYTISEAWLNRVQEVVDYAIDNDMYVIINIHHDNSTSYMYPTREYIEQSKAYVRSIWSQVAPRFADYGEHLIMEAMNEPRMVGTNYEWWIDLNSQECVEAIQCINELNQLFVDTVRASGGNNADRYLLVPGYDASLHGATNEYFELPQDIEQNQNKVLVEVHAYTPYNFALQAPGESGSTDQWSKDSASSISEIDSMMDTLYEQYVKNGVGVVIDEFGARDKDGNIQARTDYAAYYIAAARARSITCCWWDNNSFEGSGERFGIFDRKECRIVYPELVDGMMKYSE